ncbi:MAG TPA: transcriptional regulator, partial [Pyrinomonadaceae bacterium]|nr:transcriptional regulator [Pyrinomonadaceae bacterium]
MNQQDTDRIAFAEFELDRAHRRLYRGGEPVAMYGKAFDLLEFLVTRNGAVVSKDEILESVWPGQFVEESNLSVQVSALRKALGERADDPRFLVTIPGKGYKFVADLARPDDDATTLNRAAVLEPPAGREREREEVKRVPASTSSNHHAIGTVAAAFVFIAVLGLFAYKYFPVGREAKVESLAVLPFTNQNSDASTEYL